MPVATYMTHLAVSRGTIHVQRSGPVTGTPGTEKRAVSRGGTDPWPGGCVFLASGLDFSGACILYFWFSSVLLPGTAMCLPSATSLSIGGKGWPTARDTPVSHAFLSTLQVEVR